MNQQTMDQNAMNNQMMMQQMARGNNPMMGMPNLNDASGNLNQMMGGGYDQNPNMNQMMNQANMNRMQVSYYLNRTLSKINIVKISTSL